MTSQHVAIDEERLAWVQGDPQGTDPGPADHFEQTSGSEVVVAPKPKTTKTQSEMTPEEIRTARQAFTMAYSHWMRGNRKEPCPILHDYIPPDPVPEVESEPEPDLEPEPEPDFEFFPLMPAPPSPPRNPSIPFRAKRSRSTSKEQTDVRGDYVTGESLEPKATKTSREPKPDNIDGFLRLTETDTALQFLQSPAGQDIRYSLGLGWLAWDGQRWALDPQRVTGEISRWIREEHVPQVEAMVAADAISESQGAKWIRDVMSNRGLTALASLIRQTAPIDIPGLDADPWALNTPGGVVDLRTGEVAAHDRQPVRKITRVSPASSGCPRWVKFITEISGGDQALARYLQAAAGYTLAGSTEAHRAFLLVGGGSNGKSVFLTVLQHVLGDYATTADKHTIIETRNEQHPAALAALEGARMIAVPELPDGRRLDSDRFKALVGGDEVSARLMRQNPRTFRPQAKLWITMNSLPRIADDSEGMWRRIVPIPFNISFTGAMIDYDLEVKLKAEAPGILAWMLDGLRIYREEGLVEPACIQEVKGEYRRGEDEIVEFKEELEIEEEPTIQITSSRMYEAYAQWAKRRGYRPMTHNNLSRRLKAHGIVPVHTKLGNAYIGWRFRASSTTSGMVRSEDICAD